MKICLNSVEIVVVSQDIDGDMDLNAMGVGKLYALLHLVMAEILGLGAKPEGISADINRIGTMIHRLDTALKVLSRRKKFNQG